MSFSLKKKKKKMTMVTAISVIIIIPNMITIMIKKIYNNDKLTKNTISH